jgi:Protein of unknown function (DUF1566)
MQPPIRFGLIAITVYATMSGASIGHAAATPSVRCEAGKLVAAGRYGLCRQNATADLVSTGDSAKYTDRLLKCDYTFNRKWNRLEEDTAVAGAACPDGGSDPAALESSINECATDVAAVLDGNAVATCSAKLATCVSDDQSCTADLDTCNADLDTCRTAPPLCGNGVVDPGEACDIGALNGKSCVTEGFVGGTLTCGVGCVLDTTKCFTTRYVDNGDGTITDRQTSLQWEQKTGTPGALVDCSTTACPNPHDVNNVYAWSNSGTAADGGAFTDFISKLNACTDGTNGISPPTVLAGGFADRCDWRVPTVVELETLMLAQYPCGVRPCLDSIFTPTGTATSYWSATTRATAPAIAWGIYFGDGFITFEDDKTTTRYYVRAVRNAS